MIGIPPNFPVTPLTMAKESQKPHTPKLLERILKIDTTYKTKDGEVKYSREEKQ
jgi:hypothetical protein